MRSTVKVPEVMIESILSALRDFFFTPKMCREKTLNWLLNNPPTAANLGLLRYYRRDIFYSLNSLELNFHVLPGKVGDGESCLGDSSFISQDITHTDDEFKALKRLNDWVCHIKRSIASICNANEHVVLLAGSNFEDALQLLYFRSFEIPLREKLLEGYPSILDALNKQAGKGKCCRYIKKVHVFITECSEFNKMLGIIHGNAYEQPCHDCYNSDFFIDDELSDMLKACEDFCHASSVADGEPQNKDFPTPGGVG
jgi:hypothetical protein